jgi:predicted transcriptional regulator
MPREMSVGEIAERAGVNRGTVAKADAGEPVALRSALKLHALTRIPIEALIAPEVVGG